MCMKFWGVKLGSVCNLIYNICECIWLQNFKLVNRRSAYPFVTVQGVDLNVEPSVEDSAPPCDTLPIVCSTSTPAYQVSLIEARGPNSRGAWMLRVGLASIGKPYDPQPVTTTVSTIILTPPPATPCYPRATNCNYRG